MPGDYQKAKFDSTLHSAGWKESVSLSRSKRMCMFSCGKLPRMLIPSSSPVKLSPTVLMIPKHTSVEKLQSYTTIKLVWPSFEETGAMDHQPADASRIPTPRNFDAIIFNCCHQTHQHKRY
uniref:Uncharacterized protein n=1 Tax=Leersia perrieri TaxID=77586 RepID=A0A0D9XLY1_9ORYZ